MLTEERLKRILNATPAQLDAVDSVLSDEPVHERPSLRLYRIGEAAAETGLSRTTIWRAISEHRLGVVQVRRGSRRIPEAELRRFCGGVRSESRS